ncbi:MAG TPA: aldo/keto reductase [Planctomycetaceae bacterium]|nr:aldo/keto reductase [Planctomycetaceae bacterium]
MEQRPLGRTGLEVSVLGFGAFKIGRNEQIKYANPYPLPDEPTVARLLNGLLDLGITHFDTAPAYGLSEERLGRCLAYRRREFVLSTKVGEVFEDGRSRYDFSAAAIQQSVDHSLSRLQTDAVDVLLIHAPAADMHVLKQTDAVAAVLAQKQSGKSRAVGFSGKTVEAAQLALEWADVLMVEYHLDDTSHADVIAEAHRRGIGVMVKKGLASGRLPPQQAIPFVLAQPGVSNLVVGGLSLEHMRSNTECCRSPLESRSE